MKADQEYWENSDPYELAVQEAENILESYQEDEPYSSSVPATGIGAEEFEQSIKEAVDDLEIEDDYDFEGKLLAGSGALTSSIGAAILVSGNPVGLAPFIVGGGQYFAAKSRGSSEVKEVETKAFLQDAMYRDLSVEEENGEYVIEFEQ